MVKTKNSSVKILAVLAVGLVLAASAAGLFLASAVPVRAAEGDYTVTFDSKGGSTVAPISVSPGTSVEEPGKPTKRTFTFKGWYKDAELTQEQAFPFTPTEDVTLYAKWGRDGDALDEGKLDGPFYDEAKVTWPVTMTNMVTPLWIIFGVSAAALVAFGVLGVLQKNKK